MDSFSFGHQATNSNSERSNLLPIEEDSVHHQGMSPYSSINSRSSPINSQRNNKQMNQTSLFRKFSNHWLPSRDETISSTPRHHARRSWRRRIFLIITEPDTSIWSAIFFFTLILAIAASNVIMIMQTMDAFQFVPTDCVSCGGKMSYMFEDDEVDLETEPPGISCVCPPSPLLWTIHTLDWLIYFLTVEWIVRVLVYTPSDPSPTFPGQMIQWFHFLTDSTTLIDALSIFPYYLERLPNGLVSLRIFRLLRIFQLLRLGQYNIMFQSLTNVMTRSIQYLKLLMIVLAFGAAFFGSMAYWMEKGTWKFYEPSGEYQFVRTAKDGTEEPTPFTSIPAAFWWFLVTATTVGYGVSQKRETWSTHACISFCRM
jgi:hypothetical protein